MPDLITPADVRLNTSLDPVTGLPNRQQFLLVESIIELGHRLDFRVVAEGIETVETFATLRGWGCDEGQGYYFNRPMEPALLQEWFEARR
jgi:EAL domain-containing protein (putative c-di-GMP-specific phosphodiesterase class I)